MVCRRLDAFHIRLGDAGVKAQPETTRPDPAHADRLRRLATYASVAVGASLAAAKLTAWLITGSVTVLSSLLDSLVDVAASVIILISVHHALRPPDRSHRFGHGKAEPLGALAQAAFIAGSGLFVVFQAVDRLIDPEPLSATSVGIAVMLVSIAATAALVGFQRYVIRVTGSLAITADSLHYKGDLLINLAVIGTLVAIEATGQDWLDPLTAMAIAAYLLINAGLVGRDAFDLLMDRELPQCERDRIISVVRADRRVRGLHDLRTRSSGTTTFIELHLELEGSLTLNQAHDVADAVESALAAAFPGAAIIIHQEPAGLEDDRLDDAIARGRK